MSTTKAYEIPDELVNKIMLMAYQLKPHPTAEIIKDFTEKARKEYNAWWQDEEDDDYEDNHDLRIGSCLLKDVKDDHSKTYKEGRLVGGDMMKGIEEEFEKTINKEHEDESHEHSIFIFYRNDYDDYGFW